MLTSTATMRQNINAVENGRHGLGGPHSKGALRHPSGGVFMRACIALMNERRGTSKDVPLPLERSANPRRLALHLGRSSAMICSATSSNLPKFIVDCGQVLKTLANSGSDRPDRKRLFLWPSVRLIKYLTGIRPPDYSQVLSARPPNSKLGKFQSIRIGDSR